MCSFLGFLSQNGDVMFEAPTVSPATQLTSLSLSTLVFPELHMVNATETSAPHATLLLVSSDKYLGSDPACGTVSALTQSNRKCWARSGHKRLSSGWYAVCFLSKWAKNRKDFRHHLLIWETTALFFFWQWFRGTLPCLSYFFQGGENPFVSIIYSLNAHNVSVCFSPVAVVCQREYKPDNVTSSIHLFLPALLTVNPSAACVFHKSYFLRIHLKTASASRQTNTVFSQVCQCCLAHKNGADVKWSLTWYLLSFGPQGSF